MTDTPDTPDTQSSFLERRKHEIVEEGMLTVPLDFESLEAEAERHLETAAYDYVAGSAGRGLTERANREAFQRWRIVPHTLRDVSERSLQVDFFGETLDAPLLLSPVGRQARFHDRGELASAGAASSLGVPFTMSTWSTTSIEDVADHVGDAPRLFQVYWVNDWEITASLIERAERAGYDAIVITVDSKVSKWRTKNLSNRYEVSSSTVAENFLTDPVVRERLDGDEPLAETVADAPELSYDQSITWEDLAFIDEHTSLPVLLKGILHPDDARTAVEHGVDGVVVSTHGGRQLDGGIGAVEALPAVVEAVDGDVPVYLDSGVRTGADTYKALALGAEAVFLGRPFVYGLALAGERGVYEVLHNHLAELESVVGLTGHADVEELGPDDLRRVG